MPELLQADTIRGVAAMTEARAIGAALGGGSPLMERRLRALAHAAAYVAIIVGSVVIVGWIVDSELLKGAIGVPITMKANAALCFLLSGIALKLTLKPNAHVPYVRAFCAAVVALIGGLTILEHVLDWDAGIDQMLFRELPGQAATASPGRMGPPASFSFLCIGLGLLFTGRLANRISATGYLPMLAVVLSLVALVGYAYGSSALYAQAQITGIAWPTAATMLILGLGTVAARPDSLVCRIACAQNAGGAAFRRLIGPALLLPFLIVLAYGLWRDTGSVDALAARATLAVTMILALCTVVAITAHRIALTAAQAEAEVLNGARELEDFFDNAVVGLHWVNEQGIIVRANKAERELLGYDENEYVGRPIADFHADAEVIADILERLKRGELIL